VTGKTDSAEYIDLKERQAMVRLIIANPCRHEIGADPLITGRKTGAMDQTRTQNSAVPGQHGIDIGSGCQQPLPRIQTTYLPILPDHTSPRRSLASRKPRVSSQLTLELALNTHGPRGRDPSSRCIKRYRPIASHRFGSGFVPVRFRYGPRTSGSHGGHSPPEFRVARR
jgi:hypothetical protein